MTLKDLNQEKDEESPIKHTDEIELNEKHLSLIYDTLSDAIFLLAVEPDDCFRFVSMNQAFLAATGLTREQVVGKRIEQVLPETAHALVISKYKEAIVENKTVSWEQASTYPTGESVGAVTVTPVWTAEGVCTHLVGSVHDLTEVRRMEKILQECENRYNALFENANDLIQQVGPDGKILHVNKKWLETLEYSQEEAKDLRVTDIIRDDQIAHTMGSLQGVVKGENVSGFETIFITKNGKEIYVEGNGNGIFEDGKFISTIGIFRDTTKRKEAEEALCRAHENTKTILEKAPFGVVVIGRDRKIKRVNDNALKMAGIENVDIMLGKDCGEYLCPAQQKECPILDKGQQVDNSEQIFRRKDGKEIPIIKTVTEINMDGEDVLLETFVDNTERKRAEEEIKKFNEELELRVKDRTAELEKKNQDLEIMNKGFVGRELRMIELKKRIAELEKDVGPDK